MCIADVDLAPCGHYKLVLRGEHCSNTITRTPCSQPKINRIMRNPRICSICSVIKTYRHLIDLSTSLQDTMQGRCSVETQEAWKRNMQNWEAAIERAREVERFPFGSTDFTCRNQMLCVLKYQAEEMRSVILADED